MGYNYKNFRLYSKKNFTDLANFADAPDKQINFPACGDEVPCAKLQVTSSDKTKTVYNAKTISFHAPSEHTVEGSQYDLELHFTHEYEAEDKTKAYAILAFFFDVEENFEENPFLTSVFDAIISSDKPDPLKEEDTPEATSVGINEFFSEAELTEYWVYEGSLTYPPCTEGVTWNIFKKIQKIHPDQLKEFTKRLAGDKTFAEGKGNNREVQPITEIEVRSNKNIAANTLIVFAAYAIATLAALSF